MMKNKLVLKEAAIEDDLSTSAGGSDNEIHAASGDDDTSPLPPPLAAAASTWWGCSAGVLDVRIGRERRRRFPQHLVDRRDLHVHGDPSLHLRHDCLRHPLPNPP